MNSSPETYDIIFETGWNDNTFIVLHSKIKTLEEAKEKRVASGDTVVYSGTRRIVKDKSWLWDWELKNPDSYQHKRINQHG